MDKRRFDNATRAFGSGASRRGVLTAAAAAGLAATGVGAAAAKKGGKGKGNGKTKAGICHQTGDGWFYQQVPQPALKGHLKHGDALCPAEGAAVNPCLAYGCDPATGLCTSTARPDGVPCTLADGQIGACTGFAECALPALAP